MSGGIPMLATFAVGAMLAGLTFSQVIAWDPIWTAWVQANFSTGPLSGMTGILEQLPGWIFVAQILVTLAAAMPKAIKVG